LAKQEAFSGVLKTENLHDKEAKQSLEQLSKPHGMYQACTTVSKLVVPFLMKGCSCKTGCQSQICSCRKTTTVLVEVRTEGNTEHQTDNYFRRRG